MVGMRLRHAPTLALVGWYLMVAPTQEQLDSTCRGDSGPSVMDHVAALVGHDDADIVHRRRCDQRWKRLAEALATSISVEVSAR